MPQRELGNRTGKVGEILIETHGIREMKLELQKIRIMGDGAEPGYISIEFQAVPTLLYLHL